jgi:hypothetical protein
MIMLKADHIFYNGTIYLLDSGFSTSEAIAIRKGKVLETGSTEYIRSKYPGIPSTDLEKNTVYPGFIDSHCHFMEYGLGQFLAPLSLTNSMGEIIEILKKHTLQNKNEWITGWGWDQNKWPAHEYPHRHFLDQHFSDRPVFIKRTDGHAALANTFALQKANITKESKIAGGEVILDKEGPTGLLIDQAQYFVEKHIPEPGSGKKEAALLKAQKDCFSVGLTTVGEAGLPYKDVLLIDKMQKSGTLHMNIYAMLLPSKENLEYFISKGHYQTPSLNIRSIKLFFDGALGSRGALLLESYADNPANKGVQVITENYVREIGEIAHTHGYQLNTHCIGDAALRKVAGVYKDLLKGRNNLRWRIEHAQIIHPRELSFFGDYSVIPSVQPIHATSDWSWVKNCLGPERVKNGYQYKSLKEQNGWIAMGSDFPVEPINPLKGFYAAVFRKDEHGKPENGFQTEEALTRQDALRSMTLWAAQSFFEENTKGSLEPGKYADFVITDKDIMLVDEKEILNTKICATFLRGKEVFSK